MAGRPKRKVFVYEKHSRGKLIETVDCIENFKKKYLPQYKEDSKFPLSQRNGYIDLGDKIASLNRGARELYRQYLIDTNKYTLLTRKLKADFPVEVYNLKGEKISTFINVRLASDMTGVKVNDIYHQFKSKKNTLNERGLIFKKA